ARHVDSSRVRKGEGDAAPQADDSAPAQMAGDTAPTRQFTGADTAPTRHASTASKEYDTAPTKQPPMHEDVSTKTTTQADAIPKRASSLESAPIGLRKASITDSGGSKMRGA